MSYRVFKKPNIYTFLLLTLAPSFLSFFLSDLIVRTGQPFKDSLCQSVLELANCCYTSIAGDPEFSLV